MSLFAGWWGRDRAGTRGWVPREPMGRIIMSEVGGELECSLSKMVFIYKLTINDDGYYYCNYQCDCNSSLHYKWYHCCNEVSGDDDGDGDVMMVIMKDEHYDDSNEEDDDDSKDGDSGDRVDDVMSY